MGSGGFAQDEPISLFPEEPEPFEGPEFGSSPQTPIKLTSRLSTSDYAFRAIARGGGLLVLVLMVAVGSFLAFRATQALGRAGFSFLTTQDWNPDGGKFGIAAMMVGTVLIALVAICVAVPLSLGAALYISEYAPRRIQRLLVSMVDVMAAVPSIVFGLWGAFFLQWKMTSLSRRLNDWLFWIPLFTVTTGQGVATYRVIDLRRAGDLIPPYTAGSSRLVLVTADGPPLAPTGVLDVDAELTSKPNAAPAMIITPSDLGASEQALGTNPNALIPVVLWGVLLLGFAALLAWARRRWGRWQCWIVAVPVAGFLGLSIADQVAQLLPNLM